MINPSPKNPSCLIAVLALLGIFEICFSTSAQSEERLNATLLPPTASGGTTELAVSWQGQSEISLTANLVRDSVPSVKLIDSQRLGNGVSVLMVDVDPDADGALSLEVRNEQGKLIERWERSLDAVRAASPLFDAQPSVGVTEFENDGFVWESRFTGPGVGGPNPNAPPLTAVIWDDGNGPTLVLAGQFLTAGSIIANHIVRWDGTEWMPLGAGLGPGYVEALTVYNGDLVAAGSFTESGGKPLNRIARWNGIDWLPLGSGLNDTVRALAVHGGELVAAGNFTEAGGFGANRIARWNGVEWSTLSSGMNAEIFDLAIYEDDLIAGGFFIQAGGSTSPFIARWDGDAWTPVGVAGPNGFILALTVHGGDLIAGGGFDQAGGQSGNSIAAWDGSAWSIIGGGIGGAGEFGVVRSLATFQDRLIVGGNGFSQAGGITVNNIASWDGKDWSNLEGALGIGVLSPGVWSLIEFEDALIVGGQFNEAGGVVVNGVARWDGLDWSLPSGLKAQNSGLNANVWAAIEYGGDLIVGGAFNYAGDSRINHIARWDGQQWHPLGEGTDADVRALAVYEGDLVAGGTFGEAGGIPARAVARWDGAQWLPFGSGGIPGSGNVFALTVYRGDLIVGGTISSIGRIARWDGTNWLPLGGGVSGYNNNVSALAVHDGDLIVGGSFAQAGGIAVGNIARWDGNGWSALGDGLCTCGEGPFIPVQALRSFGGDLYAGGNLTNSGGNPMHGVARWDGSSWSALGGGISGAGQEASGLAVYDDKLFVAGNFSEAGGNAANHIAAWDGNKWSPVAGPNAVGVAPGAGIIRTLTVFNAGGTEPERLVAGGTLQIAGGVANWHVGFYGRGDFFVAPDSLDFGWLLVGETRGPLSVTLSNLGLEDVTVDSISVPDAPFSETGGSCEAPPFTLAPDDSCDLDYAFSPTVAGPVMATVIIDSDVPNGPHAVTLLGSGSEKPMVIDPELLDFGVVVAGEVGGPLEVTLINADTEILNVTDISSSILPFKESGGSCSEPPFSLSPSGSCSLAYTFSPGETGSFNEAVIIGSDASGSPDSFSLQGEGLLRELTVLPPALNFGTVTLGETAGPLSVTLTNTGDASVGAIDISGPGSPFAVTGSDCGSSLDVGGSCSIDLIFSPSEPDQYLQTIEISSNAPSSPNAVLLLGMGTGAVIDLNPGEFSEVVSEGQVVTRSFNIGNLGNEPLHWAVTEKIELTGMALRPAIDAPKVQTMAIFGEGALAATYVRMSETSSGHMRAFDFTPSGAMTSITHSNSMDIMADHSVVCASAPGGSWDNHFMRVFNLADFGIVGDFEVSEVTFGVQNLTADVEVTVNLYTLDGELAFGNMDLIGSATQMLETQILSLITVPVNGIAPVNTTLVVEIFVPELFGDSGIFYPGSNNLGETALSYIAAPICGTPEPVPFSDIGYPDVHLVMTVAGQVDPVDCALPSWLGVQPDEGTVAASASQLVTITLGDPELPAGDYEGYLCLAQSDPIRPFAIVPMTLTVEEAPLAEVAPASFTFVLPQGATDAQSLTIGNAGSANLEWTIEQAKTAGQSANVSSAYGLGQGAIADDWSEDFDNIALLPGTGWAMINNSSPAGSTNWFQGDPGEFPAHAGGADSYIAADMFNTSFTGVGTISNWLITPEIALNNGTELRFWTRSIEGSSRPDRIEVRLSAAGGSVDVGSGADSVGDFSDLLLSINEDLEVGGYPMEWTEFVATVTGLSAPVSGRLAFRYFVTSAGVQGPNSRYIGIDSVSVEQPPPSGGCFEPVNIGWLRVEPSSGNTAPGSVSEVDVLVDTGELALGEHQAQICVNSNDPTQPIIAVSVNLTVEGGNQVPGMLEADPMKLSFGEVAVGMPDTSVVTLIHTGAPDAADLLLSHLDLAGHPVFGFAGGDCAAGTELAPQESCMVKIRFEPIEVGLVSGVLQVQSADGQTVTIDLTGIGVDPESPIFSDRFEHE